MQPGASSLSFAVLFAVLALLFFIGVRGQRDYSKAERYWTIPTAICILAMLVFLGKYCLWDPNPFKGHRVYGNRFIVAIAFLVIAIILGRIIYRLTAKWHAKRQGVGYYSF